MSHRQLECLACGSTFTVDENQEETRCVSCGTKYAGPWDAPSIVSSPVLSAEEIQRTNATGSAPAAQKPTERRPRPATDGGQPLEIDAAGGTVEIVIRLRRE